MAKSSDDLYDQVEKLIRSRPGMDPRNYSDTASYRQDLRRAFRYRRPALDLLERARQSVNVATARQHLEQYNGWLELVNGQPYVSVGLHYPTEYRRHIYDWLRSMLRANGHAL